MTAKKPAPKSIVKAIKRIIIKMPIKVAPPKK
jgi:hypothetical protein